MARTICTMTRRDVLRNKLREAIQGIEYDSAHGVSWHIGRLDRLFWKLEMQEFPILDNYRIWALVRSLPNNLSEVAYHVWGRYEGRISYTEMCWQLLQFADQKDPLEVEEDPEEDLQAKPKEAQPDHARGDSKKIGLIWITTVLVSVLVGVVIGYLVY